MRPAELIALLQSAEYADFLRGTEALAQLRTVPELLAFNAIVEETDNDHLRGLFQKQLFRLFSSDLMELNGLAMQLLLEQATIPQKEIRAGALSLLEEFLASDGFTYFKKLISFRRSFRLLSTPARVVATRLIGVFNLKEAHSLILENFTSGDRELITLTMEIFRRAKDSRGNRYLRALIKDGRDPDLSLKALGALSELGHYFDQSYFKTHLSSKNPELKKAALRGLYRLRGSKVLALLAREFRTSSNPEIRGYILELLADGKGSVEVELLIDLWNSEVTEAEDRRIEWMLGELEGPRKLGPILKAMKRSPESLKHKLIVLLNEISSTQCYDYYRRALQEEKNDFLLISVMEAISYYDRPESIPLLRRFMKDPESFLHYYAFSSIVRHTCLDLTEILEEVALLKLPDDRHHHQLVLSVLAHQKSLTNLTTFLQAYVLLMLRSSRGENRYLAYKVVGKFYLLFELRGVFDLFQEEKNDLVIEEGRRIFGEIFARAPQVFMEAAPGASILESDSFAQGIGPSPSLLLSLFGSREERLVRSVGRAHPVAFRRSILELAQSDLLPAEVLSWIDLTGLSFRDFELLWEKFPQERPVQRLLLESLAKEDNPKFGEFILQEYLERGGEELAPFVAHYVREMP